jgi:putative hydroxymethylpyrimidine transport system permease protein
MIFRRLFRLSLLTAGLLFLWEGTILVFDLQPYILPGPLAVFLALSANLSLIAQEALTTITETLLGFIFGCFFGCTTAIALVFFRPLSLWLLPLVIVSQALPTFAIAPLFVIWFGYGLLSKIATTMLMLFFPVASAFYDGLRQTDRDWLDLAKTMNASKWRLFWHLRIPAALPSLASGLRMAAAIAPIGAIIGEWVGSSHGLGYLMLNANARMQIDFMFATLLIVTLFALALYFGVDYSLKILIPWHTEAKEGLIS